MTAENPPLYNIETHLIAADWNARYFGELRRKYARRDRLARLVLAITAAVGAISKPAGFIDLSALAALSAIVASSVMPILKWPFIADQLQHEETGWTKLRQDYERALGECSRNPDPIYHQRELDRLVKIENELELRPCAAEKDDELRRETREATMRGYQAEHGTA